MAEVNKAGVQIDPSTVDWAQLAPHMGVLSGPRGAEYLEQVDAKHRGYGEKITYRTGLVYLSGTWA